MEYQVTQICAIFVRSLRDGYSKGCKQMSDFRSKESKDQEKFQLLQQAHKDINIFRQDFKEIKNTLKKRGETMEELKSRMKKLSAEFERIKKHISSDDLKNEFKEVKSATKKMRKKMKKMDDRIFRIEGNAGLKDLSLEDRAEQVAAREDFSWRASSMETPDSRWSQDFS